MASTNPARGMRDFLPADIRKRNYVIGIIKQVYESYGFEPLETPSVENLETLMGKYGDEGNQLVFKILKRGQKLAEVTKLRSYEGEDEASQLPNFETSQLSDLALRYDLTVPLARVVANNKNDLPKFFKRYQIQPVWRADRPARGRFREFYQCDVDSIGSESMVVEAEIILAASKILMKLGFDDFKIRINHRAVLSGLLEVAGIAIEKHDVSLVALDKIDKIGREGVERELSERGISDFSSQKLLSFFEYFIKDAAVDAFEQGERKKLTDLGKTLSANEDEVKSLLGLTYKVSQGRVLSAEELATINGLIEKDKDRIDKVRKAIYSDSKAKQEAIGDSSSRQPSNLENIDWDQFRNDSLLLRLLSFTNDNSAALRGADKIAKLLELVDPQFVSFDPSLARGLSYYTGMIMEVNVPDLAGSLGGGGRYDGLIGMFGKEQIPACGFSLGLERILVVMEERGMFPPEIAESTPADVMVTIWNEETIADSLKLATELRGQGLRVTLYPEADKLGKQFKYADQINVPFVCILGDSEIAEGKVTLKNLASGEQETLIAADVAKKVKEQLSAISR